MLHWWNKEKNFTNYKPFLEKKENKKKTPSFLKFLSTPKPLRAIAETQSASTHACSWLSLSLHLSTPEFFRSYFMQSLHLCLGLPLGLLYTYLLVSHSFYTTQISITKLWRKWMCVRYKLMMHKQRQLLNCLLRPILTCPKHKKRKHIFQKRWDSENYCR